MSCVLTGDEIWALSALRTQAAYGATVKAERQEFANTTPAMRDGWAETARMRVMVVHNNHMELRTRAVY